MSRRRISTFAAAMIAAVMVGLRDSTGLAPPPPVFVTEEVHWLSPELDDDAGLDVWLGEPEEPHDPVGVPARASETKPTPLGRIASLIARFMGSRP